MEKIMKLAALMREAKALIDEIEREEKETGISIIEVKASYEDTYPEIHLFQGLPKATNYMPAKRYHVETKVGDYWKDETFINGVKFFEIDAEKKEGEDNASMAV